MLSSRLRSERRPDYIIPFKVTKERCKEAYIEMMKKAIYAPGHLRNKKNIQEFRGIYIPYWLYDVEQKGPVRFTAMENYVQANYDITEKEIDHISLNYLSTEMAVDTGQSMSAYQCFLQAMQQEISSLSDNGCYDAEGRYYTLEEAPESMQQWIREYKILQYYMLFDGQES